LRLVALIEQASVVHRILRHLGLPTEVAEPRPARAPPREPAVFPDESQATASEWTPHGDRVIPHGSRVDGPASLAVDQRFFAWPWPPA
jgi:hypothetical protein